MTWCSLQLLLALESLALHLASTSPAGMQAAHGPGLKPQVLPVGAQLMTCRP